MSAWSFSILELFTYDHLKTSVFPRLCTHHNQLPAMEQRVTGYIPQGNRSCTLGDSLDGTVQTGFQMGFLGFL